MAYETSKRAKKSLAIFFNSIFAESIEIVDGEKFAQGNHINHYCHRLQNNTYTCTILPRKHCKSSTLYAYIAWLILNIENFKAIYTEWFYLSYKEDLAAEHTAKIKKYIKASSYYNNIHSFGDAESILKYVKNGKFFTCKPAGILSFKRGRHPHGVICDDILRDIEGKKIDPAQLEKINRIFEEEILSLPKEGGELHVAGTPQSQNDLLYKCKGKKKFNWDMKPAIINYKKKEVLWKEKFDYNRLQEIRTDEVGNNAFQKEYQLVPARSQEGYLSQEDIYNIIIPKSKSLDVLKKYEDLICFGGFDIGKKRHPSHLSLFAYENISIKKALKNKLIEKKFAKGIDNKEENCIIYLKQVVSKWLENWDYTKQKDLLNLVAINFGLEAGLYDNTRGEFEGFTEEGELEAEWQPFIFNSKSKALIAVEFEKFISGKGKVIRLLDDSRQTRQILVVDNDLVAEETSEGHGDAFWSNALAIYSFVKGATVIG